jgi:hypothetical protein
MPECKLKNLSTRSLNSGGTCRNARLNYIVSGVAAADGDPESAALAVVRAAAPDEMDGAALARLTLIKSHGSGIFEVQAEYEQSVSDRTARKRIGDRTWLFDTTGGRENVIYGELINSISPDPSGKAPYPGPFINWNGKHGDRFQVSGTSKIVASLRESCVAVFKSSDMTASFRRTIMELTGCVNGTVFHGWQPGEMLFLGASSASPFRNNSGVMLVEVTFRFAIKNNVDSLVYAGVNLGKAGGWDVPWCITDPTVADFSPTVIGVYLSSIYKKGDFSRLKL